MFTWSYQKQKRCSVAINMRALIKSVDDSYWSYTRLSLLLSFKCKRKVWSIHIFSDRTPATFWAVRLCVRTFAVLCDLNTSTPCVWTMLFSTYKKCLPFRKRATGKFSNSIIGCLICIIVLHLQRVYFYKSCIYSLVGACPKPYLSIKIRMEKRFIIHLSIISIILLCVLFDKLNQLFTRVKTTL